MRSPRLAQSLALVALAAAGCGSHGGERPRPPSNVPVSPTTISFDTATRFQTLEGFGASLAFYVNWLTDHPARDQIYQVIFADLGLDVLRVANWFENSSPQSFDQTVAAVKAAEASLGHAPRLLVSSWSPPSVLKSTGATKGGGTLSRDATGGYDYAGFADWWQRSLVAYQDSGVHADFVSMQNEPDFTAAWESCLFAVQESATRAGYAPALSAVGAVLDTLDAPPVLLAPEVSGIANNRVQNYLAGLAAPSGALGRIGGLAHHLYNGGGDLPDAFLPNMTQLASDAESAGLPLLMTEFSPQSPDMFDTAWLIHDALTVEGVSAYLYWALTWAPPTEGPPGGLVTTENPYDPAHWVTAQGFQINDTYYALQHYAKWVDAGWQRIAARASDQGVLVSGFVSPDAGSVTLVLLNADGFSHAVEVDTGGFAYQSSQVFRSSGDAERGAALGSLADNARIEMPARSIVSVTLGP